MEYIWISVLLYIHVALGYIIIRLQLGWFLKILWFLYKKKKPAYINLSHKARIENLALSSPAMSEGWYNTWYTEFLIQTQRRQMSYNFNLLLTWERTLFCPEWVLISSTKKVNKNCFLSNLTKHMHWCVSVTAIINYTVSYAYLYRTAYKKLLPFIWITLFSYHIL